MKLWLVGQTTNSEPLQWEFQGVFSSEELAVKACTHYNYFVTPIELDREIQHEKREMPGCYYPSNPNRNK